MDGIETTPPSWEIPPDPGEKIRVSRNGESEEFSIAVEDKRDFLAFFRELHRRWKMWEMLDRAAKRYETGEVSYRNAAENLEHLLIEREKLGEASVVAAREFWRFTDMCADADKVRRVEKLFEPHGEAVIQMVAECCQVVLAGEVDRKN